jgi:hypothetical protein
VREHRRGPDRRSRVGDQVSTTTGPVTFLLPARALKIGMTVHFGGGDYGVVAADAEPLGSTRDGNGAPVPYRVRVRFVDGVVMEPGDIDGFDIVTHAAMFGDGKWITRYAELRRQFELLVTNLEEQATKAYNNAAEPPEVRAAHGFELGRCVGHLRAILDLSRDAQRELERERRRKRFE